MIGPSGSQFSVTSSSPQLVLCLMVLACGAAGLGADASSRYDAPASGVVAALQIYSRR